MAVLCSLKITNKVKAKMTVERLLCECRRHSSGDQAWLGADPTGMSRLGLALFT